MAAAPTAEMCPVGFVGGVGVLAQRLAGIIFCGINQPSSEPEPASATGTAGSGTSNVSPDDVLLSLSALGKGALAGSEVDFVGMQEFLRLWFMCFQWLIYFVF